MLAAFNQFCVYLERVSGIVMTEEKKYLVESRILPIVRRERMTGLAQLVAQLTSGRSPGLEQEVIHAMTINETYFFRDKTPFEVISDKVLPRLHEALPPNEPIRIWSAACSTGQEPYTLSIIVEEKQALLRGRRVEIIATDVSDTVLKRAREGVYSSFEVERGLSPARLKQFFTPFQSGWKVSPVLQQRIAFRVMNLISDYSTLNTFDLILCRNVLIYFNGKQKADVLRRLGRALRPGGYLMLGASESAVGSNVDLVADSEVKGCYRLSSGDGRVVSPFLPAKAAPVSLLAPRTGVIARPS